RSWAVLDGNAVEFHIGRVCDWEAAQSRMQQRKLGIIDAVYVNAEFRGRGIGIRLVERALQARRDRNAVAAETIYESWSADSAEIWRRVGFAPWMVHAYRRL